MGIPLRISTFNLENLDNDLDNSPTLAERLPILRSNLIRIRSDIICFQEINSQKENDTRTLAALSELITDTDYVYFHQATTLTTTGKLYHERNLVTLSRFPIVETKMLRDTDGPQPSYQMVTADPPDETANAIKWERPMLYTKIDLQNGKFLHLINLHMKSKIATSIPGQKINNFSWKTVSAWAEGSFISSMKRVGQALQARLIIDDLFDIHGEDTMIVVCGDFNAEVDEVPLRAICGEVAETGNPAHVNRLMIPCENNIPKSSRYSLLHLGKGNMLDHIIASRSLITFFRHAEIHNEALSDESGAFRTDAKFPESDHAPVVAEFVL
jgi:endonuclease/exonuclease/phosphatase family metal-dependent hydrolase